MLVTRVKKRYVKKYVYGGSGIFSTIGSLITRLTGSTAKQLASKLALSAGKAAAAVAATKLVKRVMDRPNVQITPQQIETVYQQPEQLKKIIQTYAPEVNNKVKEIISKYSNNINNSVSNLNNLIHGNGVMSSQDIVRQLNIPKSPHRGTGMKVI